MTIPAIGVDPETVGFPLGRNCVTGDCPGAVQEQFPILQDAAPGDSFTFSATGGVDYYGGTVGVAGPDGYPGTDSAIDPLAGISAYNGPHGSLVGVFLTNANPAAAVPPAALDFSSTGLGTGFATLAPAIGQVFFIGNGNSGAKAVQTFTAPAGATRLFLGIADAFAFVGAPGAYDDDIGAFVVTVNRTPAVVTHTVTYLAGANGHIEGETPQTVTDGADSTEVTAVADLGHHFVDWSDGRADNPRQDTNVTADITVTANFAADTTTTDIQVAPQTLNVSCLTGTSPADASFLVRNAVEGTVSYTLTESIPWLSVNPTAGSSSGEWDTITVTFAAAGLAAGTYNGTISVAAPGREVETVDVTLNVVSFLMVRSFAAGCYGPGDTVDVALDVDFGSVGTVTSLVLNETVPAGWQFLQVVSGPVPDLDPVTADPRVLAFSWIEIPAFPFTLVYRLAIPGDEAYGTYCFTGTSAYRTGGPEITVPTYGEGCVEVGECCVPHQADQNGDWIIQLSPELTRLIQFYNRRGYDCLEGTEDGYAPGAGATTCLPHQADQNGDWIVQLSPELTRMIQFYNSHGYHCEEGTEDGYAPGASRKAGAEKGTLTTDRWSTESWYFPGGTVTMNVQLQHTAPAAISSLTLTEVLPPGWTFQGVTSTPVPLIRPSVGATGTLEFGWVQIPTTWPFTFSYQVQAPPGAMGPQPFSGTARFREDADEIAVATPIGSLDGLYTSFTFTAETGGVLVGDADQVLPWAPGFGPSTTPVTANALPGYDFVGWSSGGTIFSTDNPLVMAPGTPFQSAIAVLAEFEPTDHTVTFNAAAGGTITGQPLQVVSHGGNCSPVTATPRFGYVFTQWNDGVVTPTRTVTNVTSDLAFTAQFRGADPVAPNGTFLAVVDGDAVLLGRGWYNLSGAYTTSVKGDPLVLNLVHDTKGKLTGNATYTTTKDTAVNLPIKGTAKGTGGNVLVKITLKGADPAKTVAVALTLNLAVDEATNRLVGTMTGSVKEGGVSTPVNTNLALPIPAPMDGTWTLRFQLAPNGTAVAGTAALTLSNGTGYDYVVKGKISGQRAALSLAAAAASPAAKGIKIKTTIVPLEGGWAVLEIFSGKGLGQTLAW